MVFGKSNFEKGVMRMDEYKRYGWRGKIGLIYPAPGLAGEIEFHRMAPEGVAILTTRVLLEKVTPEGLEKMTNYIEEASSLLSQAAPDVIAFGCTTGSLLKGVGYDKEIIQRIETRVGVPAITTSTAVIDSFKALKVKKVAVVTPYFCDELNRREKAFLEDSGFEVISIKSLKPADSHEMEKPHTQYVRPEQMYKLAKETFTASADVMFISCTGLGLIDIIEVIESELERPVITSNQATMWAALRRINISDRISGLGKLFDK